VRRGARKKGGGGTDGMVDSVWVVERMVWRRVVGCVE
jgi:hypothetical protein